MTPESITAKSNSPKDGLSKALLENNPLIEVFTECIDSHRELSLKQKVQWLTFTTWQYNPIKSRSIIKPRNPHDVSDILDIPETEVMRHIKFVLSDPNCESLWEKLQKEIDEKTKKNPKLSHPSRIKKAPIPQETIDKVIWQRTETNHINSVIARIVRLSVTRLNYLIRKLVNEGKIPARGPTKSRSSNLTP